MKSQLRKSSPWIPAEGFPGLNEVGLGFQIKREALYAAGDDGDDCFTVVASFDQTLVRGLPLAIPMLTVALPGLCGHYRCGDAVSVVMN
jgi:hypothetical protein